jgi:hypothetical protein
MVKRAENCDLTLTSGAMFQRTTKAENLSYFCPINHLSVILSCNKFTIELPVDVSSSKFTKAVYARVTQRTALFGRKQGDRMSCHELVRKRSNPTLK